MSRLSRFLVYLCQPLPAPWFLLCLIRGHRPGQWREFRPGKHDRFFRHCMTCETAAFLTVKYGKQRVMTPSWRTLVNQWLCAMRPGGHGFTDWVIVRRQTNVAQGLHTYTLARDCQDCGLFQVTSRSKEL